MNEPQIFCPRCAWRPQGENRWQCSPRMGGCGTVWNAFWTAGVCPGCAYRWQITFCPSCRQFSPHEDWYHWPEGMTEEREHKLEIGSD